jgi:hypothetical protein
MDTPDRLNLSYGEFEGAFLLALRAALAEHEQREREEQEREAELDPNAVALYREHTRGPARGVLIPIRIAPRRASCRPRAPRRRVTVSRRLRRSGCRARSPDDPSADDLDEPAPRAAAW